MTMFNYYLKLAFRSLAKTPATTCMMLLAIALGIGVSMTTIVLHYMRSADPIPQKSDRLHVVQLQNHTAYADARTPDQLYPQSTYRDTVNIIASDIPVRSTPLLRTSFKLETLSDDHRPAMHKVRMTNTDFFSMFNVPMLYGQPWGKVADEQANNVTVIGENLNQELFGGRNSVGEKIYLQGKLFEITGVIKHWQPVPKFYDTTTGAYGESEQIFIPFSLARNNDLGIFNNVSGNIEGWKDEAIRNYQNRLDSEEQWLLIWVEFENKEQQREFELFLEAYIDQQQELNRFTRPEAKYDLKNVKQWLDYRNVVGEDNYILLTLSFLFLIVCLVNTLGLMLSKFLNRAPNIGVRRALGANRAQIFLQHLVEIAALGLIGGLLGILLTFIALKHLQQYSTEYKLIAQLDWFMLVSSPVLAITVTILAGIYPAWVISQTQPARYLKSQ